MTGYRPNGERNRPVKITGGTTCHTAAATAFRFFPVLLVADWRWRLPTE